MYHIMMILLRIKIFIEFCYGAAFAVQARELTQSQSILQNQLEKIWNTSLNKVLWSYLVSYQLIQIFTIKLTSKSASSLSDYLNSTLTGGSSGVQGFVTKVDVADGTDLQTHFMFDTQKLVQTMLKLFLMMAKL